MLNDFRDSAFVCVVPYHPSNRTSKTALMNRVSAEYLYISFVDSLHALQSHGFAILRVHSSDSLTWILRHLAAMMQTQVLNL
jgi:hypothetical protein